LEGAREALLVLAIEVLCQMRFHQFGPIDGTLSTSGNPFPMAA
jgi:hypothetical protein